MRNSIYVALWVKFNMKTNLYHGLILHSLVGDRIWDYGTPWQSIYEVEYMCSRVQINLYQFTHNIHTPNAKLISHLSRIPSLPNPQLSLFVPHSALGWLSDRALMGKNTRASCFSVLRSHFTSGKLEARPQEALASIICWNCFSSGFWSH